MTRVALLRAGYGAIGLSFLTLAAAFWAGSLLVPGMGLALLGAILLAFSKDRYPTWAGALLVGYFLVSILAFLASTPITIRKGGRYFVEAASPELASAAFEVLAIALPLVLAAAGLAAVWPREKPTRILMSGATVGFLLTGLLTLALTPSGLDARDVALDAAAQGNLLQGLFALSALCGAAGIAWAAARPTHPA